MREVMNGKLHFCTKKIIAFVLLVILLCSFIGFIPMRRTALAESIVSSSDEAAIKDRKSVV